MSKHQLTEVRIPIDWNQHYEKPLSPLAERLLHTTYYSRSSDLGPKGIVEKQLSNGVKYRCIICSYEHEGELPDDIACPICGVSKREFKLVSK